MAITGGRGSMPSFSTSLNAGQLERLIAYLRTEQDE
jgi:hypothetical protein